MLLRRFVLLTCLVLCCSQVSAKITLKKTFFGGWKYSLDGTKFKGVGLSGNGLRNEMTGSDSAQMHMQKYKSAKIWGVVTGIPGGFLLGWPLGSKLGGKDWTDTYTAMIVAGVPLSIASFVFEEAATRNLKKAVNIYNGDDGKSLGIKLDFVNPNSDRQVGLIFGLSYQF